MIEESSAVAAWQWQCREDTHLHLTGSEYPSNWQMLRCQWGPNDENHCGIMTLNSLNQNVKLRSFLPASVSFTAYLSSSSGNVNRKGGWNNWYGNGWEKNGETVGGNF